MIDTFEIISEEAAFPFSRHSTFGCEEKEATVIISYEKPLLVADVSATFC
jgi:hypothetical protein